MLVEMTRTSSLQVTVVGYCAGPLTAATRPLTTASLWRPDGILTLADTLAPTPALVLDDGLGRFCLLSCPTSRFLNLAAPGLLEAMGVKPELVAMVLVGVVTVVDVSVVVKVVEAVKVVVDTSRMTWVVEKVEVLRLIVDVVTVVEKLEAKTVVVVGVGVTVVVGVVVALTMARAEVVEVRVVVGTEASEFVPSPVVQISRVVVVV